MILAIDTDKYLSVYSSADEVARAIDVHFIDEGGEFRFFDETGQELVGEVIRPKGFFKRHSYLFKPIGTPNKMLLLSIVAEARDDGSSGWFNRPFSKEFQTLSDLKTFLSETP